MTDLKVVESLVLDATPLITQSASSLQQYANTFYTTPGVRGELRDEHARNQMILWGDVLKVRQPKQESIDKVTAFSKLTGDYSVLSMNDVHIIALAYELEVEQNGEANLRQFPGQQLDADKSIISIKEPYVSKDWKEVPVERSQEQDEACEDQNEPADDCFQVVARKKRFSRKHYRQQCQKKKVLDLFSAGQEQAAANSNRYDESAQLAQDLQNANITSLSDKPKEINTNDHGTAPSESEAANCDNTAKQGAREVVAEGAEGTEGIEGSEDYNNLYEEEDNDGEWITPENLQELIMRDDNETIQDTEQEQVLLVALSTGDFACQNTSMQLGLNLLNPLSGKQITRVRNSMYRCHACFHMLPMPKSGERKHFCPKCGGDTLLRCAVSIDNTTGKITPHLKVNFQWIRKGQIYSIASPLSKNSQKKFGHAGYQHKKGNRHKTLQDPVVLREDQKEYAQAIKDDAWHRKKNEKMLAEWIGGGSADNYISPFPTSYKSAGVRIGRGRNANALKKKK